MKKKSHYNHLHFFPMQWGRKPMAQSLVCCHPFFGRDCAWNSAMAYIEHRVKRSIMLVTSLQGLPSAERDWKWERANGNSPSCFSAEWQASPSCQPEHSLVSAAPLPRPPTSSLFLHHSFPPGLLDLGNRHFRCFTFEPSNPEPLPLLWHILCADLLGRRARHLSCQLKWSGLLNYSQRLSSQLDEQSLTSNLVFRKPN